MSFLSRFIYGIKKIISDFVYGYILWLVGYFPSMHVRLFIYKFLYHVRISKNVVIYKGVEIRSPKKMTIGDGSIIGDNAILDARMKIDIGRNVNFSYGVHIWTLQHDYRDPYFKCNAGHCGPIKIEDRVWIGPRATTLHSVTIGEGAVVAAGAIVTKDENHIPLSQEFRLRWLGKGPENYFTSLKAVSPFFLNYCNIYAIKSYIPC